MSFLFGSTETKSELPGYLEDATKEMLARSLSLGKTGYMPWSGPDVAAVDPAKVKAMESNVRASNAFGIDAAMPRIPDAQDFGNGMWGYSSKPLYDQQMETMRQERPGQLDYYNSHFVDPVTGAPGANMNQGQQQGGAQGDYWSEEARRQRAIDDVLTGHLSGQGANMGGQGLPPMQGPQQPGYTGLSDMFNGGGPGASGPTYQGGGLLSDFGNLRNDRKGRNAHSGGGLFGGWF